MKKMNKKAFTLIELLIVIAIIGILFIVLVSKVDFATDKAKATGVQTDFRSYQMAFETVAKENAGFTTFGWDQGDVNQDGKRNSFDEKDVNFNGTQDDGEDDFTGRKKYNEALTGIYSLMKYKRATANDPTSPLSTVDGKYDTAALARLETAINANLDPKLHITIDANGLITMANGAQDPWKTEYQGYLLTTDTEDDRGAIVLYSLGANAELGSVAELDKGVVTVAIKTVPATMADKGGYGAVTTDNNKAGKDDYSLATVYTYKNGYGEVISTTTGFSNNQITNEVVSLNGTHTMLDGVNSVVTLSNIPSFRSDADANDLKEVKVDGNIVDSSNYTVTSGSTIITFKESFIRTLENGTHSIEIVSSTGTAQCNFEVNLGSYFTVGSSKFYFEENMSWNDFLCSQYNVDDYFYNTYINGGVIGADNLYLWANEIGSGQPVNMYDTIQPNTTYYLLDYND